MTSSRQGPPSVLVAGGAGFVGSHLVEALLEEVSEVMVVDSFDTGSPRNLASAIDDPRLALERASISDPLPPAVTGRRFDRIYHLASPASPVHYARLPLETLKVNSLGTMHLLELARRDDARLLLASTSEVYGDPLVHPQPETYWGNVNPNGPRSCYDEGKRFSESVTMTYVREHGLDARIARIFNTYGPRSDPNDGRMIPNFCVQALRGQDITVYGDGQQTRSCCYVTDLVAGLVALMETPDLSGEVVNLGNPEEQTVLEIARRTADLAGSGSSIVHRPLPTDDPARRRPDIDKAQRLLGWSPTTSFEAGISATLEYFRTLSEVQSEDSARVAVGASPSG
ncbi:MAG TPA: UDP-glucuronic acid decarboxylase family protein [Candidatus Limnocylindrales bacterium]|nr:UDP-glucuronic acid decarboxylase family protein [Candidatus Limnocylindrales bacterium]